MSHRTLINALAVIFACTCAGNSLGQRPTATPSSSSPSIENVSKNEQETIRVNIEEVRIPVFAFDDRGHFDPTLSVDDLLVREDGVAQRVAGIYRVPAFVLVLVDTGGLNPTKSVRLTRAVANSLVSELRTDDWVAVMQVNSTVELIKEWSKDRSGIINAINTKLLPTNRDRLAVGIGRAADYLQKTPVGNRHLVIISDGYEVGEERNRLDEAIKELASHDVTVHIISYTSLGTKRTPITYAKAKSNVPEEIALSLPAMRSPDTYVPDPKDVVRARGAFAVDIDQLFRGEGDTEKELMRRESEFVKIAQETGGFAWLPVTIDETLERAAEAARDIDAQYVVTYKPKKPLAEAKAGEYRRLDVISRRVGLYVRSRRGFAAKISLP